MGMELGGVPERSRVGTVKIHYVYMYKVLCYKGAEVGWGWLSSRAPGGSPSVGLGNLILLPKPAGTPRRPDLYSKHPDCMRHCIHSQVTGGETEAQEGYGTCHRSHG